MRAWLLTCPLLTLTSIAGCAVGASSPDDVAPMSEHALGTARQALDSDYVWSQNDQPSGDHSHSVQLMHSTQGVCFLTGITGSFRGDGEAVLLHVDPAGYWALDGHSFQQTGSVGARAHCVPWNRFSVAQHALSVTDDFKTSAAYYGPLTQPSATPTWSFDSSCALSGISGQLNAGSESVSIDRRSDFTDPSQRLTATTGARDGSALIGNAMCLNLGGFGRDNGARYASISAGDATTYRWTGGSAYVTMTPVDKSVCFLTRLQGGFYGADDAVFLGQTNGMWTLGGHNGAPSGMVAEARCLAFDQTLPGQTGRFTLSSQLSGADDATRVFVDTDGTPQSAFVSAYGTLVVAGSDLSAPPGPTPKVHTIDGAPATVIRSNGALEVFVHATDGSLVRNVRAASNPSGLKSPWNGFTPVGRPVSDVDYSPQNVSSAPVVLADRSGRLIIAVIGGDGHVYTNVEPASPAASPLGWVDQGEPTPTGGTVSTHAYGTPTLALDGAGRMTLMVRGADGQTYATHVATDPSRYWSAWTSLGGAATTDPVLATNADGRLEVFVRDPGYHLCHQWERDVTTRAWSGWDCGLGGYVTSKPAVWSDPRGLLHVFVRGGEGNVWEAYETTDERGWSAWNDLNAPVANVAAIRSDTRIYAAGSRLFFHATDSTLVGVTLR